MKSYTYRPGAQIACPYCGSIQVKAMANQPKKYPRPEKSPHFHSQESLEQLYHLWQNGYDCKKCGNEFVALPEQPSKAGSGFFSKLIMIIIGLLVCLFVAGYFIDDEKPQSKKTEKPDSIERTINEKQLKPKLKYETNDPTPLAVEKPEATSDTDSSNIDKAAAAASSESTS